MTKRCFKCNTEKPIECFSKNKGRSDGHSGQCKECHTIMRKEHYEKNKKKIYSQVDAKKKEYHKWILTFKHKPCVDCKIKYPHYVMDFDHLKDKEFNLSQAARHGYGKEKVLKEIAKCELVCANCHRERTHKRFLRG